MPGGRPSSFKPEYVEQAAKLCNLGATDFELADFFGVNVATIHRWKAQFPEFCDSIKTAKAAADERVERSLYARASGYSHVDTDIRVVGKEVVKTAIVKHYPPDTAACIFWLKNRRSNQWRDKTETTITGFEDARVSEEIMELRAGLLNAGGDDRGSSKPRTVN